MNRAIWERIGLQVMRSISVFFLLAFILGCFTAPIGRGTTLQVGPGQQYAKPCAAITVASPGDTITIDSAGNYNGDVCQWSTNNLTIIGVGAGRAVINAAGQNSQGKGIWVISGDNTDVENIEFTGATVPDNNGTGIRQEGNNLTLRNCYFHDNQEGILTDGGLSSTIVIEYSEFARNGFGDGFTHNVYIGNIGKLIFRYNYSHSAFVGHLLKSRAAENDILYNRFSDESDGTTSYEIDIPNGGLSYIIGNLIEQGPLTQNSTVVSYQEEGGTSGNPSHDLFVVNNTLVNDYTSATFVLVDGSVSAPAVIKNNVFQGPGQLTNQSSAIQANNFAGNAQLVSTSTYDYHLQASSPAVNTGGNPGTGDGFSLSPVSQYVHPACAEGRTIAGASTDIGAYELNGGNAVSPPNSPSRCGSSTTPAPIASLSPSNLTFANQILNTISAGKQVTLSNTGNATLSISGVSVSGDFAQSNTCTSVVAGGNCVITITFTPTVAGTRNGILSITDNASGSPHTTSLSGTGVPASTPGATLTPSTLSFGNQSVGTSSSTQAVTLTNSGNASLSISGISVSGDFSETHNCGATLGAAASCSINVTFQPTVTGTRTGTLSVNDNASGSPQTATLSGSGVVAGTPSATFLPASLNFTPQIVGTNSAAQSVKLTNSGNATMNIGSIAASGDFTQTNSCSATLAANASCTISLTFKPVAGGSRTGTLVVTDNASGSPQRLNLSGTGMDYTVSVSIASGSVAAGQTANATLVVSPDGGFNQAVSLSCSGAPTAATCSAVPSSLTLDGTNSSSATLAITTTARSGLIPELPPPTVLVPGIVLVLVSSLGIMIFARKRSMAPLGSFAALLFAIVSMSGCAGIANKTKSVPPPQTPGGTPAGAYVLTITASSGTLTRSATFTLNVQ